MRRSHERGQRKWGAAKTTSEGELAETASDGDGWLRFLKDWKANLQGVLEHMRQSVKEGIRTQGVGNSDKFHRPCGVHLLEVCWFHSRIMSNEN